MSVVSAYSSSELVGITQAGHLLVTCRAREGASHNPERSALQRAGLRSEL
jgi:hypothetical protein